MFNIAPDLLVDGIVDGMYQIITENTMRYRYKAIIRYNGPNYCTVATVSSFPC